MGKTEEYKTIAVKLPLKLYDALKHDMKEECYVNMSEYIRRALNQFIYENRASSETKIWRQKREGNVPSSLRR